jgi:hypothetical protein
MSRKPRLLQNCAALRYPFYQLFNYFDYHLVLYRLEEINKHQPKTNDGSETKNESLIIDFMIFHTSSWRSLARIILNFLLNHSETFFHQQQQQFLFDNFPQKQTQSQPPLPSRACKLSQRIFARLFVKHHSRCSVEILSAWNKKYVIIPRRYNKFIYFHLTRLSRNKGCNGNFFVNREGRGKFFVDFQGKVNF